MNTISQIFPKTGRISGPEVGDGAKPDVPTTDRQNEKKKKHRPFYEAVDAHARRRLKKKHRPFYEAVDAHARRRLKILQERSSEHSSTFCEQIEERPNFASS